MFSFDRFFKKILEKFKSEKKSPLETAQAETTSEFSAELQKSIQDLLDQKGQKGFLSVVPYDEFLKFGFYEGNIAANYFGAESFMEKFDTLKKFLEKIKNRPEVLEIWFGILDVHDPSAWSFDEYPYAENVHILVKDDGSSFEEFLKKKSKKLFFEYKKGFFYGKPDKIDIPESCNVWTLVWD